MCDLDYSVIGNCNIYPSINTFYNYISADSITRNFSCTDVNNNLQTSYSSCCITLLITMKGLRCTANSYLSDTKLS